MGNSPAVNCFGSSETDDLSKDLAPVYNPENNQSQQSSEPLKPLRGTLILTVLRGNNLVNVDSLSSGKSDPYVKVRVMTKEKIKLISLQTKVLENSLDPIWNERFSINCEDETEQVEIRLQVWDEDPFDPHDPMGQIIFSVNSNFPFDQDLSVKLTPMGTEKVTGSLTINLGYRPGEQIDLNQDHLARVENKKHWNELPSETKQRIKEWRACKDVLTESEELRLALLTRIYQSNFHIPDVPPVFRVETKKFGGFFFEYKKSTWQVDQNNLTPIKYLKELSEKKGDFVNESKDIIELICDFQTSKQDAYRSGYLNDPEGLWCEEFKEWAVKELSILSINSNTIDYLDKRIGYLEECLLVSELFDRPSTLAKNTIQQVIIRIRHVLKYRAIANVEKELSHEDATRDFADLKREITGLIRDSFKFLKHVFRCETRGLSNADKLLMILETDKNLKLVLGDELAELRESIKNSPTQANDLGSDSPWGKIDLREYGLKNTVDLIDPIKLDMKSPWLVTIFSDPNCGLEEWFRSNAFIAFKFLRAHGLLLELGKLFVVIEKASNLAKTGGTLLVFGLGNAHLNASLDATDKILEEMKKNFNELSKIAECCFEELVFSNLATKDRTLWIGQFKDVFPLIGIMNKSLSEAKKVVSKIKITANSVSLSDRFAKAATEQGEFIETSQDFAKRVAQISGTPYVPPKPKPVAPEENDAWMKLIKNNK